MGLVFEDVLFFISVLQILVIDWDVYVNGWVQYIFQNGEDGDGDFIIEFIFGIVCIVRWLDWEVVLVYELIVYVVDRGVFLFWILVSIQVMVQDVNDNVFVFLVEEFEVWVKENSIVGLVVVQIIVVDFDEGFNVYIMYQIVEGNIFELF